MQWNPAWLFLMGCILGNKKSELSIGPSLKTKRLLAFLCCVKNMGPTRYRTAVHVAVFDVGADELDLDGRRALRNKNDTHGKEKPHVLIQSERGATDVRVPFLFIHVRQGKAKSEHTSMNNLAEPGFRS